MEYKSKQGQTWDMIAKEVYGNELYADFLMKNNKNLLDYFVFPEGICIIILPLQKSTENTPSWRKI